MDIGNGGELVRLRVDDLVLDQTNPRIARLLTIYGGEVTSDQMRMALGAESSSDETETTYHTLRVSIQTNQGIIHPVIVNECDRGLVVIEGNTRTLIYQEFKRNEVAGDWSTIPCIVYHDLPQQKVDAIRLQAHLVGPRPWDPYSKAKYLDYLRNSQHLTWQQVVDFCGGQSSQAKQLVDAYNDMEYHYRQVIESDDEFDPRRFSAFVELQTPRVTQALIENGFDKTDFAEWVHKKLVFPLDTVRSLPVILEDPEARATFLTEGARAARREIDSPSSDEVIKNATLRQLADEITQRILAMSYSELNQLRQDANSVEVSALADARDNLVQLCSDIAGA